MRSAPTIPNKPLITYGRLKDPQGLVSCLYRLDSKMPIDFSPAASTNERLAALAHFDALEPDDVVVFDRGYFSYELLYDLVGRGAHPVFRIQRNSVPAFDRFRDGDRDDATVVVEPGEDALRDLRRKHPGREFGPLRVRLVRYEAGGSEYCLATTLADADRYGAADLSDLYHGRWSIEELRKVSKSIVEVDQFHGRSERGAGRETFAHFNPVAATRVPANEGDDLLAQMREEGKSRRTADFKNALALVAANLEELLLAEAGVAAEAAARAAAWILAVRSRLRPGRSYRKGRRANGRGGAAGSRKSPRPARRSPPDDRPAGDSTNPAPKHGADAPDSDNSPLAGRGRRPPKRNPATGCRPSTEIAPGAAETSKKADKKSPNQPNARIPN